MRAEPDPQPSEPVPGDTQSTGWTHGPSLAVTLAAVVGLGLLIHSLASTSATYDEVAYLRVAARWWRTGDQAEITRMGSPLTFWKVQQVPVLWALDLTGRRALVDDPI